MKLSYNHPAKMHFGYSYLCTFQLWIIISLDILTNRHFTCVYNFSEHFRAWTIDYISSGHFVMNIQTFCFEIWAFARTEIWIALGSWGYVVAPSLGLKTDFIELGKRLCWPSSKYNNLLCVLDGIVVCRWLAGTTVLS